MKEYNNLIWIGIFVVIVIGILVWLAGQEPKEVERELLNRDGITLFYGDGCPHCEDVDKYIQENDIESKVEFVSLEVWKNKVNAKMMKEAAVICELDLDKTGVPFLFDGAQCYIGAPDVQGFFAQATGL